MKPGRIFEIDLQKIKFIRKNTQISQQGDVREDGCKSSLALIPRSHLNYSSIKTDIKKHLVWYQGNF